MRAHNTSSSSWITGPSASGKVNFGIGLNQLKSTEGMDIVESFVEAHLENNRFTAADLVRLAKQTRRSTYEIRRELEGYGLVLVKSSQ